ncbi:MAG TPA: glycoside hydrolase 100 family protein [Gaiellaceae bacterium]|nr:glycoside hydrolase 100 family protein [Gaiellaceae bacterium]
MNYRRVWARDGVVLSLAALVSGQQELVETARRTLETLADHHGPHGEIPSNFDPVSGRVSYGSTTGRIDADLWFVIGCGEYWRTTGDDQFIANLLPRLEKTVGLIGAWEFNARGLLYVPLTGDWADEYLHSGYVLYDQLLYLEALRHMAHIHSAVHGSADHELIERISRLRHLIRANYWFPEQETETPLEAYHAVLYEKGRRAAGKRRGTFWMPSFSPSGYSYRFDALANVLVSLLDVADDEQRRHVDRFIAELVNPKLPLLPAFHPVIEPMDADWQELQLMFSNQFKNDPYEYQNGGLWPMITGFYVADLARRGRKQDAERYLDAIDRACVAEMQGKPWGFPEYVHGKTLEPRGTREQGWSAAAALIGHYALEGAEIFDNSHGHD